MHNVLKMVKHTLEILRCVHCKIFSSMSEHLLLRRKGLIIISPSESSPHDSLIEAEAVFRRCSVK